VPVKRGKAFPELKLWQGLLTVFPVGSRPSIRCQRSAVGCEHELVVDQRAGSLLGEGT